MNEERDPLLNPIARRDEFPSMRQEQQIEGNRRVINPPPQAQPQIPVGISPPDPLVVVSNFDTRPISAFDFCFSGAESLLLGDAGALKTVFFQGPSGYTVVLRRIEIEFVPTGAINLTLSSGNSILVQIFRNGGPIPSNDAVLTGALTTFEWLTHQVFGFWDTFGVGLSGSWEIPLTDVNFNARLYGTLIPSKSRSPETEIASNPVLVEIAKRNHME